MSETATYPVPEPSGAASPPGGRRTALIAGVTAVILLVVGGGAYAAMHFLSGGAEAESALPASSVAVASINLDPGASQKVEALKTFRKFPGLRKQLKISSGDDLRRVFFEQALKDSKCKNLSYDADVKPWIGDSAAVAAVPFGTKVAPVLALAVTDQDKAKAAYQKLHACGTSSKDYDGHVAFTDGFMLVSDTQAHADEAVKETESKPLADDAAYQKWSDKAGDRGIVNFYVAKAAASYAGDKADQLAPSDSSSGSGAKIKQSLKNFEGAAGALRFADGGMELEVVGGGLPDTTSSTDGGNLVAGLPKDTAAAVGVGVPSDFAAKLVKNVEDLDIPLLGSGSQITEQLQTQLGLSLPDDLATVLGKGVALSVGGKAPADLSSVGGLDGVAAGLSVAGGDATKIQQVVSKLEQAAGGSSGALQLHVEQGSGKVALSFDSAYADDLKSGSGLGDQKRFSTVVPHADTAQLAAFVDFDSDWVAALTKSQSSEDRANLAPLQALGLSAWRDGDTSHLLLKVTTD